MADLCIQDLTRLTHMPDNQNGGPGDRIAGQLYYDVEFTGGSASNLVLTDVTINGAVTERQETVITAPGNYIVQPADYVIFVDKTVPEVTTITLPASPTDSRSLIIKDAAGNAGDFNITINGNGQNIDGQSTYILTADWESVEIIYGPSPTLEWSVVGTSLENGDVIGPISSTDNAFVRFDGVTGRVIQNSGATLSDTGVVSGLILTGATGLPLTTGVTGILAPSNGGTGSNLSATGGTSQVLLQTTAGGNVSVAQLAASDLSNGTTGSGAVVLATSPTINTPTITGGTFTPASLTVIDNAFTIKDDLDNTKTAQFQLSGLTTGTAAVYTMPNLAASTLATINALTQTFTGTTTFSATAFTVSGATPSIGTATIASTIGLGNGATTSAVTKTVNIATAGLSGSISNTNIGSAVAGSTGTITMNSPLLAISPVALATTTTARFQYTINADTTLTTTVEAIGVLWDLSATRTHATGAITLQRDYFIKGSNHAFAAASTITNAAAFSVDGPPIAGTNATFTNAHGVYLPTKALTGTITNAFGLTVAAPSGATNNFAANFTGAIGFSGSAGTAGFYARSAGNNAATTWAQIAASELSNGVTGSGAIVLATSPTVTGISSNTYTSTVATGTAPLIITSTTLVPNLYAARAALADTVTTNANLTGPIASSGNTTSITSQTGTGTKFVVDTSPTLITPNIGTATGTGLIITSNSATAFTVGAAGATNPSFNIDASTASSATGLNIKSAATGGTTAITATDSGANSAVSISTKGNGNYTQIVPGAGSVIYNVNGGNRATFTDSTFAFTPNNASATTTRFLYTAASDASAAFTASTETLLQYFNNGITRQHATGALTLQRDFRITGSTQSFVAASTVTDAAAFSVDGPIIAGTNATLTNSHAIYVPSLAIAGTGAVTNGYGLTVNAPSGAGTNYAAQFTGSTYITNTATNGFVVGQNGITNPALRVNTATAASTSGIQISSGTGAPVIQAIGSATNVGMVISSQLAENLNFYTNSVGSFQFGINHTGGTIVNQIGVTGAITGNAATLTWQGSDANQNATLVAKGTGVLVNLGSYTNSIIGAANVAIDATGKITRATSMGKYKTDMEPVELSRAETIMSSIQPVWFRSLCVSDLENHPEYSYYGFIAEDVAAIDPRLAQWGLEPLDTFDEHGIPQLGEIEVPIGVAYERIIAVMIRAYEDKFSRLETRISHLEKGI